MRTTLSIAENALPVARRLAQRERISLGDAVSELVRIAEPASKHERRWRFARLSTRDEVITIEYVRE